MRWPYSEDALRLSATPRLISYAGHRVRPDVREAMSLLVARGAYLTTLPLRMLLGEEEPTPWDRRPEIDRELDRMTATRMADGDLTIDGLQSYRIGLLVRWGWRSGEVYDEETRTHPEMRWRTLIDGPESRGGPNDVWFASATSLLRQFRLLGPARFGAALDAFSSPAARCR